MILFLFFCVLNYLSLVCRMETLKKHLPLSATEGVNELRRIAARFEEKIFSGAVNQVNQSSACTSFYFILVFGIYNYL